MVYDNYTKRNNIHVFFLIRSLNIGGTERQLVELVKGLDKTRFKVTVGIFYNEGALIEEIEGIPGIHVISLNKRGRWDLARFICRFIKDF